MKQQKNNYMLYIALGIIVLLLGAVVTIIILNNKDNYVPHPISKCSLEKYPSVSDSSLCVDTYGQCGGVNWAGNTQCCISTDSCNKQNDYYSQCLSSPPSPPSPQPPSPPSPPQPPQPQPQPQPPPQPSPPSPQPQPQPPPQPSPPSPPQPSVGYCCGGGCKGNPCSDWCSKNEDNCAACTCTWCSNKCDGGNSPGPTPGPTPGSECSKTWCPLNDKFPSSDWNAFPNYGPAAKVKKDVGYDLTKFTPDKWDPAHTIPASTTNYSFGGGTSCACNGEDLTPELAKYGYIGVATPDWIQTPFHNNGFMNQAGAKGDNTPEFLYGTNYVSNCSMGPAGCGKCFELTVKDREMPPLYNVPVPGGTGTNTQQSPVTLKNGAKTASIKVVNLDSCEDRNAYGPNYQWCNAAKDIKPTDTFNFSGNNPPKKWGEHLRYGRFYVNKDTGVTEWRGASDCYDEEGKWVCTNLAGSPLHFDFAVASLLKDEKGLDTLEKINKDIDWNTWNNPIVHARPIPCDPSVTTALKSKCGGNLVPPSTDPNQPKPKETCISYCPPFNEKPGTPKELAPWWGGCDNKWDCAPVNTQCGGIKDGKSWSNPTCCQWDQKCVKTNPYYSGCQDHS